ncbi:hypothetical protein [Streptomyces sp. NPDC056672]|uniref:hypothetical protein n=1 Tax=Streptomyces sp. NPDC056672 TaxID=3345906 RepID=UPI00368556D3
MNNRYDRGRGIVLRELLGHLPQFFESASWGSPARLYMLAELSDSSDRGGWVSSVQWGDHTYALKEACEISENLEIQLLAIDVTPEVCALILIAEAWSTEERSDGSERDLQIRYFHGATRQGETDTLITYRVPGIPSEFDDVTGPATICLEQLLGVSSRRSLPVTAWLAAVAASRVSNYLSDWNEGAPPGRAPLWISARHGDQKEFFSHQLTDLTGRAVASVCWEATGEGTLLPPEVRQSMADLIAHADSAFEVSLALDAARELTHLTWQELTDNAQDEDLLPVRKEVARSVDEALLGQFAGTVMESADVILNRWAPYAGQAGVDGALDVLRSTGWLGDR